MQHTAWYHLTDEALWSHILAHPITGGAPDGDGGDDGDGDSFGDPLPTGAPSGAPAAVVDRPARPTDPTSARPNGAAPPGAPGTEPMLPKHRYDALNKQLDGYKRFGSPEDIERRLKRGEEISKATGTAYTPAERERLRTEFMELFPEMRTQMEQDTAAREAYQAQAEGKIPTYLKDLGLEANDDNNYDLQEMLAGYIARDKGRLARYRRGDLAVIDEAFSEVKKRVFDPLRQTGRRSALSELQTRGTRPVPRNPRGGSATTTDKPPEPAKTLEEASERAWQRLQGSTE